MAKPFKVSRGTQRLDEIANLIKNNDQPLQQPETANLAQVPIESVMPNPYQPRLEYSEEGLEDLSRSIQKHGILQPLIGRHNQEGTITLIAGHRRWLAGKKAGLTVIPIILRSVTDEELRLFALIENLQREDLHTIDKASALTDLTSSCHSQEEAAMLLGMTRQALFHWLVVRKLDPNVIEICRKLPDFSLRDLKRLSQLPPARQIIEARRLLSAHNRTEPDTRPLDSPKENSRGKSKNSRKFEFKHPDKKFICRVEIKATSKTHVLSLQETRDFLASALAAIEAEMKP